MTQDVRVALRMVRAHRWFSLAVVATLDLGIGLNTMVFTIIDVVLFKPVPFAVKTSMGDIVIGEGTHERAIIDVRQFKQRVEG